MSGVFLSYRRSDTAYIAGRLRDDLVEHFGRDLVVFRDVESMPLGHFPDQIAGAVRDCEVVLVLIGAGWLAAADAEGKRRIDDPEDWVRREVAIGLSSGKVVVPVLLEGATLPPAAELPGDLAGLPLQQAVELPDSRWDYELARLVDQLTAVLGVPSDARVFTGPWASPDAPVVVTVEKVEVRPAGMRFHLTVDNRTSDGVELASDWFDVTDDTGHGYRAVPSGEWPESFPAGGRGSGVVEVGEGLQPAAKVLVAGWVRALGTFEVGSVFATVDLRRFPRPDDLAL